MDPAAILAGVHWLNSRADERARLDRATAYGQPAGRARPTRKSASEFESEISELRAKGQLERAIEHAARALAEYPLEFELYQEAGWTLEQAARWTDALETWKAAYAMAEGTLGRRRSVKRIADCLLVLGRPTEALDWLQKERPDSDIFGKLAEVFAALHRWPEVIDALDRYELRRAPTVRTRDLRDLAARSQRRSRRPPP